MASYPTWGVHLPVETPWEQIDEKLQGLIKLHKEGVLESWGLDYPTPDTVYVWGRFAPEHMEWIPTH
jgi:hypothetical protein